MEEASPNKHEYVGGQIYQLSGASDRHNRIAMNILGHLWQATRGGPCRVYGSDMRLRIGDTAMYYPDVQVVCDPTDNEELYKTRPCFIAEVLSPSTQSIDLREKWLAYRDIESMRSYVIVWRDQPRAQHHHRPAPDKPDWFDIVIGPDAALQLSGPLLRLTDADSDEHLHL